MKQLSHLEYQRAFEAAGVSASPSEIHGQLTGFLCLTGDATGLQGEYPAWLDVVPDSTLAAQLNDLAALTLDELDEYSDFGFRVLMPDDDEPIDQRFRALSAFCSGFVGGVGVALPAGTELSPDMSEVLADFGRVAAMAEDVPDSEENEADLVEITEYVRVSVLLVYAEFGGAHASGRGQGE